MNDPDPTTPVPAPTVPAVDGVDGAAGSLMAILVLAMLLPAILSGVFGILWWSGVLGRRRRRVGLVLGPTLCGFAVLVLAAAATIAVAGGAGPLGNGAEQDPVARTMDVNGWKLPTNVSGWTLMTNDELLAMGQAGDYVAVAGLDMLRMVDSRPGSKDDGFNVYAALAAEKQRNDASFSADNEIMGDVYAAAEVHVAIYKYDGDPRRGAYLFRSSEPRMAPNQAPDACDILFSGGGLRCTRMEDGLQWMFTAKTSDADGPAADEALAFFNDFLATQASPPFTEIRD